MTTKQQWRKNRYEEGLCECGNPLTDKRRRCEKCRQREKMYAKNNNRKLVFRYGASQKDRNDLWDKQEGNCAICKQPLKADVNVDHDHDTGKVRGLVHNYCNVILGFYEKNAIDFSMFENYLNNSTLQEETKEKHN